MKADGRRGKPSTRRTVVPQEGGKARPPEVRTGAM